MSTAFPNRLIVEGEHDAAVVKQVQQALVAQGFGPFTAGEFDAVMTAEVKRFQALHTDLDGHALDIDGKIGRATWGALFDTRPASSDLTASTQMLLAIGLAATQVGQMENTPNRGPMVDEYLRAVGIDPLHSSTDGRAWCMAFIYWVFDHAATRLGISNPLPRTAGCLDHWNRAATIPGAQRITAQAALANSALVKPGQIFILDFGHGLGHAGIVERTAPGGRLTTLEGNSNDNGSRNGVGVFRLDRRTLADAVLKGFVDYSGA